MRSQAELGKEESGRLCLRGPLAAALGRQCDCSLNLEQTRRSEARLTEAPAVLRLVPRRHWRAKAPASGTRNQSRRKSPVPSPAFLPTSPPGGGGGGGGGAAGRKSRVVPPARVSARHLKALPLTTR